MTPRGLVEEIALYLGKPWKYSRLGEPSNWRFKIIAAPVKRFTLNKERLKSGRVEISI